MSTAVPAKTPQVQWNVQAVRGKVTTQCLWNACKALSLGLLLLTIGTTMAIVGYYADQLSIQSEIRGNSTVRIKNESRGFHLNNLSYAGPIVMGIGGFIIVAACVMTFEARDSAAKVVPARFKPNLNSSVQGPSIKSPQSTRTFQKIEGRRGMASQTASGRVLTSHKLESSASGNEWSPKDHSMGRKLLTSAFVQYSRELNEHLFEDENRHWKATNRNDGKLNKSPSAPDLASDNNNWLPLRQEMAATAYLERKLTKKPSPRSTSRSPRKPVRPIETISSNLLLRPMTLQRQALSMDNPFYEPCECYASSSLKLCPHQKKKSQGSRESFEMEMGSSTGAAGSQTSMALDLHDCQVTLKVKDESANKRSDTARRHQLLRQKPVDDDREDKVFRCSCAQKCLCTAAEDFSIRTNSRSNLQLIRPSCCQKFSKGHIIKMTPDFRSQSFSQHTDPNRCCFPEDGTKIFCIEDCRRKANLSSENIRVCCEEKHRCLRKQSPVKSTNKSCKIHDCLTKKFEASAPECFVLRSPDNRKGHHPLVRSNAKKRKSNQKIKGSLSAEDRNVSRSFSSGRGDNKRSSSFSPTRNSPPKSSSFSPTRNSPPKSPSFARPVDTVESPSPEKNSNSSSPVTVAEIGREMNVEEPETTNKKEVEAEPS